MKEIDDRGRALWKAVTAARYKELNQKRRLPRSGVVELLAQRTEVYSMYSNGVSAKESVIVAPRIVQSTGSSVTFDAVDPHGFSIHDLNLAARKAHVSHHMLITYLFFGKQQHDEKLYVEKNKNRLKAYVIMVDTPDKASSNRRLMAEKSSRYNERVLYDQSPCAVHGLHRIIYKSIDEEKQVGDVHAIHFSCSLLNLSARVQDKVEDEILG